MPKHTYKIKNKNKNTNKNSKNVNLHLNHKFKRQYVRCKHIVKKEVPMTTNPIRIFTPLHQMTNSIPLPGIPIPQYSQMASHPQIPIQNPLVQYNPLVNPLRDISGRNRTIQDVFNDRSQLREEAKKQKEEIEKKIKEHEDKKNKKEDKHYLMYKQVVILNLYHYFQ